MCEDCKARQRMIRDAYLNAALGGVAVNIAKGAMEVMGLKEKTGLKEEVSTTTPALPENMPKGKKRRR